jgi:hypothetical protein
MLPAEQETKTLAQLCTWMHLAPVWIDPMPVGMRQPLVPGEHASTHCHPILSLPPSVPLVICFHSCQAGIAFHPPGINIVAALQVRQSARYWPFAS